jgi:hypothetical protein
VASRLGNTDLSVKPLSQVDEDLVKDYNAQFDKGYDRGGVKYTYDYIPPPALDTYHEIPSRPEDEIDTDIDDKLIDIRDGEKRLETLYKDYQKMIDKVNKGEMTKDALRQYEKLIDVEANRVNDFYNELTNLRVEKQQIEAIQATNNENFLKTRQANREKLAQYQREMSVINSGKFDIVQQAGETNEHYLDRLNAQANSEIVNDTLLNAQFEVMTKFKMKMKELIRTDWKIEQIANTVDNFGQVDNKLLLLKKWELFKSEFLKTFGTNNSLITVDDIIAFIDDFIYEKSGDIYQQGIDPILITLEDFEKLKKDEMLSYLNEKGFKVSYKKKKSQLVEIYEKYLYGSTQPIPTSQPKVGAGIKPLDINDYVNFGKVIIYLKKLYYKNELVVKWKTKLSIQGFKNCKVSERFVSIIMAMLEGKYPQLNDLNLLPSTERQIFDRLISLSGLHKVVSNTGDKTVSDLKHRLQLIEGEIEAGNDNKELFSEMYKVLHSLKDFGVISSKKIKEYLKQFKQ